MHMHENKATSNTKHFPLITAKIKHLLKSNRAAVSADSTKRPDRGLITGCLQPELRVNKQLMWLDAPAKRKCKPGWVSLQIHPNITATWCCCVHRKKLPGHHPFRYTACHSQFDLWPRKVNYLVKHKRTHSSSFGSRQRLVRWSGQLRVTADRRTLVVSDRLGGGGGILSLSPVDCFCLSAIAYRTRQQHPPQLLHNHGYYRRSRCLRHHFSHQCLQRSGGSRVFDVS